MHLWLLRHFSAAERVCGLGSVEAYTIVRRFGQQGLVFSHRGLEM
jgi:hypothetical protein